LILQLRSRRIELQLPPMQGLFDTFSQEFATILSRVLYLCGRRTGQPDPWGEWRS
jgi:hypothetical protein